MPMQFPFSFWKPGIAPPDSPTSLEIFDAQESPGVYIQIAWVDGAGGDTVSVERKTGAGAYAEIYVATQGDQSYFDDTPPTPGETYSYRVRAHNGGGYSAYSNEITNFYFKFPFGLGGDYILNGSSEDSLTDSSGNTEPLIFDYGTFSIDDDSVLHGVDTQFDHPIIIGVKDLLKINGGGQFHLDVGFRSVIGPYPITLPNGESIIFGEFEVQKLGGDGGSGGFSGDGGLALLDGNGGGGSGGAGANGSDATADEGGEGGDATSAGGAGGVNFGDGGESSSAAISGAGLTSSGGGGGGRRGANGQWLCFILGPDCVIQLSSTMNAYGQDGGPGGNSGNSTNINAPNGDAATGGSGGGAAGGNGSEIHTYSENGDTDFSGLTMDVSGGIGGLRGTIGASSAPDEGFDGFPGSTGEDGDSGNVINNIL